MRVVIVDDNEEFVRSARAFLSGDGLTDVGDAGDGAAALAVVAAERPDVVLVDVELGAESGFEVARALAAADGAPAIVMTSTHSEPDLAALLDDSPAAGFVAKARLSARAVVQAASR
jgi:DNA-binding NarL/FixJ family response regulator